MVKNLKWPILLFIFSNLTACSDGHPNVDFLNSPKDLTEVKPGRPSSLNLSPTMIVSGGGYQLKGRVSVLATQNSLSGGNYKIKGKISF